jgi:capsular exopolysaccharide synthesis family protein
MALVKHIEELHTLLERKEDLLYKVTEENTEVRQMNQKIDAKIAMIQRSIDAIFNRLKTSANVLKGKVSGFESDFFELPEKKMEFNRLKNIQDLNEKYFTLLMEKKVLYEISDAGYASANRILKQPKINQTPVAPNRQFIYGSFMFLGLIIGLGVMLLKYLTFNEINMVEDLEAILPKNVSILGGVPLFRYHLEFSQLIVSEAPKSSMAESMRKIRTNLSYINPNYKTIAISSSISGEGKTFVALNLGGIIAMSGKRTILLDLDMRKPKIHLGLNADNTHGMSSLIVGQSTLEQCIKQTKVEFFDFITAGPIPPNPSELILSDNFKKIVDELKELYDVVIIDNPPVGLVSDGVKNLTEADIPIYVFKSHYSKRNFAYRVKELFEMQQLKSLNVILNGVQSSRSSIYGYGYGDGYVDDAHNDKFKDDAKKNRWYRKLFRFGKK